MLVLPHMELYSFNGQEDLGMYFVSNKEIVRLQDMFCSCEMDNVVDRREAVEFVLTNILSESNLENIFLSEIKSNFRKNKLISKHITIHYFNKKFEDNNVSVLMEEVKKDTKDKNIKLTFVFNPFVVLFNETELIEFLKEKESIQNEQTIKQILKTLKGC